MVLVKSLILLAVFLSLSFMFSGLEVALFTLKEREVRNIHPKGLREWIRRIRQNPNALLALLLTANTATNAFASSLYAILVPMVFHLTHEPTRSIFEVATFTLILLIFSEVSPKALALSFPYHFAMRFSGILWGVYYLLYPLVWPVSKIMNLFTRIRFSPRLPLTEEELMLIARSAPAPGLRLLEKGLIFLNHTVRDIATPRVEIKALPIDATMEQALDLFKTTRHSRFPVYREKLDHIVGIIEIPKMMGVAPYDPKRPIKGFLSRPVFVPETMNLLELIHVLDREGIGLAVVIDEYGGTSGVVTWGDLMKFFFGTIPEEFEEEPELIKRVGEKLYILPGDMTLTWFREVTGIDLGTKGTLSSFIIEQLGRIPREGESVQVGPVTFVILSKEGGSIERVRVEVR